MRLAVVAAILALAANTVAGASTVPPTPDLTTLEPAVARQISDALAEANLTLDRATTARDRSATCLEIGQLFDAYDFVETAASWYQLAHDHDPESLPATYALAHLAQRRGELQDSEALFRLVLAGQPNHTPARIHLAELLYESGHYDEAESTLQAATPGLATEPSARALLGQIALARGENRVAVDRLESVLAEIPAANRLHYPLALAYRGLGDLEAARRHLELRGAVGVRPADPWVDELESLRGGERVHILAGRMAFRVARYAEAAQHFEAATVANPKSTPARINLGAAFAALGRTADAIAQFSTVVAQDPSLATAQYNLGRLLVDSGAAADALPHLEQAVALAPKDHEALTALADTERALGHRDRALDYYRTAIALSATAERPRLGETNILVGLGLYAEAASALEEAITAVGATRDIVFGLARLYAASPSLDVRNGKRALELASTLFDHDQTAGHATLVAQALAEQGRCAEAATWQRRVIAAHEAASETTPDSVRGDLARYQGGPPCRLAPTAPR